MAQNPSCTRRSTVEEILIGGGICHEGSHQELPGKEEVTCAEQVQVPGPACDEQGPRHSSSTISFLQAMAKNLCVEHPELLAKKRKVVVAVAVHMKALLSCCIAGSHCAACQTLRRGFGSFIIFIHHTMLLKILVLCCPGRVSVSQTGRA